MSASIAERRSFLLCIRAIALLASPCGFLVAQDNVAAPPHPQTLTNLAVARPEWFAAPVNGVYPASALAGAYRATGPWGTILLRDAAYVSPFYNPSAAAPCSAALTPYDSPRKILGTTRPQVDDEHHPQRLQGGSIILGPICGTAALQLQHAGVDSGPWVVEHIYNGVKPDGIFLPNHGHFNPKRGTRLEDVSVLTNDRDGQHSVLLEGDEGAVVDGLWIWTPGGTHGLVLKSAHSFVHNFHCSGASSDCLLVKSDYRTAANGFASDDTLDDIDIHSLNKPGDTGGIALDAHWDRINNIVLNNIHMDGLTVGIGAAGSWFHAVSSLQISNWTAVNMMGSCGIFVRSKDVAVSHFVCDEAGSIQPAAFILEGKRITLTDGSIQCSANASACMTSAMNGVFDSGKGTQLVRLNDTAPGGHLLVRDAPRYSVRDTYLEIKAHLRILWMMAATWTSLALHWLWFSVRNRG